MTRPWIFLCPSSRGIGHALTRHLLQHTHPSIPILATARSKDLSGIKSSILKDLPASASKNQDRLHLVPLDVTSEASIQSASEAASSLFPKDTHHLHMSFALPGILYPEKSYSAIDYNHALDTFKVNVLGPMMLMKYFADFLPRKSVHFNRLAEDGTEIIKSEDEEIDHHPPSTSAGSAGGYGVKASRYLYIVTTKGNKNTAKKGKEKERKY